LKKSQVGWFAALAAVTTVTLSLLELVVQL